MNLTDELELKKASIQFDYFSENFLKFEQDYYKYSMLDVPLIFITDDILRSMGISYRSYFKLNKANARDRQDHYFHFKLKPISENSQIRVYEYLGHSRIKEMKNFNKKKGH